MMFFKEEPTIRSYEKKVIAFIIVALLIVITLPSLYGYSKTPEGERFTGIRSFVPGDIFVYYSYIEQVKQGNTLLENLYTTEIGRPFVNVFWQSAGYIGKWFSLEPDMVFFVLRIVLGGIFLYMLYIILKTFRLDSKISIVFQYLFMVFFGGVGAYYLLFNFNADEYTTTLDLWSPEHNYITALIASPHFILSFTLIVFSMYAGYIAIAQNKVVYSIYVGIAGLILFQFHPYYAPLIFLVLGSYYLALSLKRKAFSIFNALKIFLPIVALSLPSIAYHLYLLSVDEVFIARAVGNVLPIPSLTVMLLGYGIYLPLAFIGLTYFYKKKKINEKELFIIVWFIVQGVLIFSPVSYQRKLIATWTTPMAILAWEGGRWLLQYGEHIFKRRLIPSVLIAVFIIATPTTYYNLVRDIPLYNSKTSLAYEYGILWLSKDRQDAYKWLEVNITKEEPVLGHLDSSVLIPAYAGRRVYIGHWSETIYALNSKRYYVAAFFSPNTNDTWRLKFLRQNNIKYLWWGFHEKRNLSVFLPDTKSFLEKTFENNEVTIYRIVLPKE